MKEQTTFATHHLNSCHPNMPFENCIRKILGCLTQHCDINICAANKLWVYFSWCSNAVKNVLFYSFCTTMLWCNFRKESMQRLHVVYNFGCRALNNLLCRVLVSHQ